MEADLHFDVERAYEDNVVSPFGNTRSTVPPLGEASSVLPFAGISTAHEKTICAVATRRKWSRTCTITRTMPLIATRRK